MLRETAFRPRAVGVGTAEGGRGFLAREAQQRASRGQAAKGEMPHGHVDQRAFDYSGFPEGRQPSIHCRLVRRHAQST
mgnify:CR=1 FL=1